MKVTTYAPVVGSLMYAQVCTHTDLAFISGMLLRYQKNTGKSHWDGVKKGLKYLQDTKDLTGKSHWDGVKKGLKYLQDPKDLMLTYKKSDAPLEIVGYSDLDFAGCLDIDKSTS
jgi:hypothetical protein